jgi:acid phosphatase (class A)
MSRIRLLADVQPNAISPKMKIHPRWIVLSCFLIARLSPVAAWAIDVPSSAATGMKPKAPNPHWLSHEEVDAILAKEPPPPAPGSDADKADLQNEIDVQNARTPERSRQAKIDAGLEMSLFLAPINPAITAAHDPKLFHLFEQMNAQLGEVVGMCKNHWKRLRPFVGHPDVVHALFPAGGYSYPSHATTAYCRAVILGQIFPDKAALLLQDADRIAESRVVGGVHYETDIKEGEVVGKEVAQELLANPKFEKELHATEAEVAAQK